uniref:C1q domain-containing protein n=1 Tax=Electrophorus electricus TaxID=8005 RepID=A0A4W4E2V5_ELEEL
MFISAQLVELKGLSAQLNLTDKKVEDLEKSHKDLKVAFSAALVQSHEQKFGPVSTRIPLVYVFTNVGNAHDPNTGNFRAPVRGVYQFMMHNLASASALHPVSTLLIKNGQQVLMSYSFQVGPHFVTSSNGASLQLEAGDVVSVELWENSTVFDNMNHHNTFSGHLLFTL